MGASVKPQTVDDQGTPQLGRILSPDEFAQAQGMTTKSIGSNPFPALPPVPAAGRDVTRTPADPNAPGAGGQMTGLGRILTQYVAQPIMDHPLTTAATTLIPGVGYAMGGLMVKDVGEYAAQKYHEMQMSPEDRAKAEANPNRIPGERAAVEAALLGAAPLVHAAIKGGKALAGVEPRTPVAGETPSMLDAAGTERLSGLPIDTETRGIIKAHVEKVADSWNQIFAPANRGPEAKAAANILRATTGEMARNYEQAAFKLDEFRRAIEPLPQSDKLGFIDAIEGGKSQPSPEFQPAADVIRQTLDGARESVQNLGTGKLDKWIEDYFPHIWTDPDRASDVFASMGAKRPMEGGKAFLKQRTIPTTLDGIQAGLEPVSYNPVDLTLLKLREMQRYVMAHESLNQMKDAGLVKFVRSGEMAPDGYQRINDKIATVFGPRQGAVQLPEGANIEPEDVTVPGMRVMGEHWAPEPVARVVNNYLSPGLRGNAFYDAYRGLGNTLNQAQLGLSAFHLGFTSVDASVSRTALGLEMLTDGQKVAGLKKIATSPTAGLPGIVQGTLGDFLNSRFGKDIQVGLGAKIRSAYMNPEASSPEMQALANAYAEGGGRARMDSFYKNSAPEKMIAAWHDGTIGGKIKAGAYSLPAAFEYAAKPIMEHIVPLQKMQVFGEMAQKALADLPPDASLAQRRAVLSDIVDHVDNRLGQMTYDNLFWNKTLKDLSMGAVRSVGWNLGTIRELGGGAGDIASTVGGALQGRKVPLSRAGFYAIALPIQVGMYGAIYQYLRTGEGPSELKDYFYPKTGEQDANGDDERVQLPSYMKDVMAYTGAPWQTVKHKVSPLLSMGYEMLQNQDFYGDEIRNPDDPTVQQVKQEAEYLAKSVVPFGIRNAMEMGARGSQSGITKYGAEVGITPAPRRAVRTNAENMMSDFLGQRGFGSGATPEQAQARRETSAILSSLRMKQPDIDRINHAFETGNLTPEKFTKLVKRANLAPAQEQFKRLTFPQAVAVFKAAPPRQQAMFAQTLLAKAGRAASAGGAP